MTGRIVNVRMRFIRFVQISAQLMMWVLGRFVLSLPE